MTTCTQSPYVDCTTSIIILQDNLLGDKKKHVKSLHSGIRSCPGAEHTHIVSYNYSAAQRLGVYQLGLNLKTRFSFLALENLFGLKVFG